MVVGVQAEIRRPKRSEIAWASSRSAWRQWISCARPRETSVAWRARGGDEDVVMMKKRAGRQATR